jgi:glutamine synthetase
MVREELIFVGCSDIAGKMRGKSVPARDLDTRLKRGIGWTPTNVQITCFDTIADSPYGALARGRSSPPRLRDCTVCPG